MVFWDTLARRRVWRRQKTTRVCVLHRAVDGTGGDILKQAAPGGAVSIAGRAS